MKKELIENELKNILKENLDEIILTGSKPALISSNKIIFKQLQSKYPNILLTCKHLIEICKNKNNYDKCLNLFYCECGNEKVLTSKFCSNHKCPAKNKSVAKNCFLTKLKNHGDGKYNNSEKNKQTCIKRYGVDNIRKSDIFKEHSRKVKLEKYGDPTFTNRDKANDTCLEKYGQKNYMSTKDFREKSKEYFQEHYGKYYFYETEEFQEKRKQKCLEKYGVDSFSKTDEFKQKSKETWLNNYGVKHPMKCQKIKDKLKDTMNKHWGDHFTKTKYFKDLYKNPDFINKMKEKEYKTKKMNNSLNSSNPENEIYEILLTKFKDIIHPYRSKEYPFNCDFYIPSRNLYIEAHLGWTHNFKPFDKNNVEHIKELELLQEKAKNSDFYKNKIYTWTDLDVRKVNIAKSNKLNWIVFYKFEDFLNWFENQ